MMLIIVNNTPNYQTNYPLLYSKKDPRGSGFIYPASIVIYAYSSLPTLIIRMEVVNIQ